MEQKISIIQRIKDKVNSVINRVKNATKSKENLGDSSKESIREVYFLWPSLELSDDYKKIEKEINAYIDAICGIFSLYGSRDGGIPVRIPKISSVAKMKALRTIQHVMTVYSAKLEKLKILIESKKIIKNNKEKELVFWQDINSQTIKFYNKSYRNFSLFTAWMCFIFGSVLLIADLPLSLQLVGFFGIGKANKANFSSIIEGNPDADLLLFALGIMFCTIYIKLLYDEYINTRLGEWIVENENKKEWVIKTVVKICVLLLFLIVLAYLGYFRTVYSPIKLNNDIISRMDISKATVVHIITMCYIGISILIPIISGVCYSYAFSIWHNRKLKKEGEVNVVRLTNEFNYILEDIGEDESALKGLELALKEWSSDEKKELLCQEFLEHYNMGFLKEYRTKYGNDFYRQVEEIRNETAVNQLMYKLNEINP